MKNVIIGERYREKLELPLISHGFCPFWLPENPNIDHRLASHCDLSLFFSGEKAVLAEYLTRSQEIVKLLTNRGIELIFSKTDQGEKYPADINLCAQIVGKNILHNVRYTDRAILDNFTFDLINVNQGYARCMSLVLNSNALISSDPGIIAAAEKHGIETLIISDRGITLDGFDRGFIGGASFVSNDTVYFTGDIKSHPDYNIIVDFIYKHTMKCASLTDEALFDIGGAVILP